MSSNFYDKVAKKFGGYAFGRGHVRRLAKYPTGDPELPSTPAAATANLVSKFIAAAARPLLLSSTDY